MPFLCGANGCFPTSVTALCIGNGLISALGFCDIHPSAFPSPSLSPFLSPLPPSLPILLFCLGLALYPQTCHLPAHATTPGICLEFCFDWFFFLCPFHSRPLLDPSEAEAFAEAPALGIPFLGSEARANILHGLPLVCPS